MPIMIPEVKMVRLYGVLGSLFGREHPLAIDSPLEAIKALSINIPGFQKFLLESKERGLTYAIFEGKRGLGKDDLQLQANGNDIRIAPVIMGSKRLACFKLFLELF